MTLEELESFLRHNGGTISITCGSEDHDSDIDSELWILSLSRTRQDRPPSRFVTACGLTLPEAFKSLLEQWNESLSKPDPDTFWDAFQAGDLDNPTQAFDEEVNRWHDSDSTLTIWEWLGMDQATYGKFLEGKIR